ncbi:MAG: PAC2 family protein [Candidatus Thermoplasmatota archaeon]|nr:PAC2 family protein [Candidatus Thermoplasmatota archaeon]
MGGLVAHAEEGGGRVNRSKLHWLEGDGLPKGCMIIEAVPGVGNVGKLVVDGLLHKHPSRTLGWMLHPDFPPHATMDSEGLIRPPRIEISSILLADGSNLVVITGMMQPMTAAGQFEVSESMLELAADSESPNMLVLAGLATGPEEHSIHVICSDSKVRSSLESSDITVSRGQPEGGMIGMAGMILSLAPTLGVPAVGIVADTIGTSSDVLAANRLARWVEEAFGIPLELDLDTTEQTAVRLMEAIDPSDSIEDHLGADEAEVSADFYV